MPSYFIPNLVIFECVLELHDAGVGGEQAQAGHFLADVLCLGMRLAGETDSREGVRVAGIGR